MSLFVQPQENLTTQNRIETCHILICWSFIFHTQANLGVCFALYVYHKNVSTANFYRQTFIFEVGNNLCKFNFEERKGMLFFKEDYMRKRKAYMLEINLGG